jgi:hypothetical protein
MAASLSRIPSATLILSRIVYFTDMQHLDSHEIPVGVAAEATLDGLCAIGVALRPGFTSAELSEMGPSARQLLAKPIATLWPELKTIFKRAAPGQALARFGQHHTSSLSIFSPISLPVPRQWVLADETKREEVVLSRLKVTLVDSYYELLFPPRSEAVDEPAIEEAIQTAA